MRVAKSKDPSGPFIKRRHAILETDWAQYGKVRGCAGSAGLLSLWCCRGRHGLDLVTALSCRLEVPGGCSTTPGALTPSDASSRADNCSSTGPYHLFIVYSRNWKYKIQSKSPGSTGEEAGPSWAYQVRSRDLLLSSPSLDILSVTKNVFYYPEDKTQTRTNY